MAFRTNGYATVWEVKKGNGNYTDVRISTSRKDKQSGEYVTDFSGWVRFIGTAHQMAGNLNVKDRIKIGDCEVTNTYDKEKKVTYTNFAVFSFETTNGGNVTTNATNVGQPIPNGFVDIPDGVDEELPFN